MSPPQSVGRSVSPALWMFALAGTLTACTDFVELHPPMDQGASDAGPRDTCRDTDGDGIDDIAEGKSDVDGDGIPADRDLDSDGDGLPDAEELAAPLPDCERPPDTDRDGFRDPHDPDADGDTIPDGEEVAAGLDPLQIDTNGDGCPDGAEHYLGGCEPGNLYIVVGCRTDPVGHLTYRWEGPGELSALELRPAVEEPPELSVFVLPTAVTPAGGASFDSRGFAEVQPGAQLHFSVGVTVYADPGSERTRLEYELLADRQTAPRVVDTVELFVFGDDDCTRHPSSP